MSKAPFLMADAMNIDLEVLALTIGVDRTSQLSQTSHDAIHALLGNLKPELHKFFIFIRDSLITYVQKFGTRASGIRLGVSSYILDTILEASDNNFVYYPSSDSLAQGNALSESDLQFSPEGRRLYSREFKIKVVTEYLANRDLNAIAKKFGIQQAHLSSWIFKFCKGDELANNRGRISKKNKNIFVTKRD
ncbi:unnamed protein product [Blepharisma stoltei]|uniref:Transposase n=1 Tax=Blepharisma stoltei TaxID=1481888 RepID=A0AAU9K1Q7_9CILI|nr:unnamed protein product [Blepharisma stoltei]